TTPNDVAQNKKTRAAAEAIAGASAGSVTVRKARAGEAPNTLAASSDRGSSWAQNPPTVRATTVTLKNASANTMEMKLWSRPSIARGPPGPMTEMKATPTTTVGSTNGTVANPRSSALPRNSSLYSTNAAGSPSST